MIVNQQPAVLSVTSQHTDTAQQISRADLYEAVVVSIAGTLVFKRNDCGKTSVSGLRKGTADHTGDDKRKQNHTSSTEDKASTPRKSFFVL